MENSKICRSFSLFEPTGYHVGSDFESCMKKVILSNLMYFSSILVKNLALAKVLTPAHEIPKTPCLQGFSPFSVLQIFLQKRENSGRKRGIRTVSCELFGFLFSDGFRRRFLQSEVDLSVNTDN